MSSQNYQTVKKNCDACGKEVDGQVYGIINVKIDNDWCEVADEVSSFIHPECYYNYTRSFYASTQEDKMYGVWDKIEGD